MPLTSKDHRTKRQKLQAMANQSVSPNEAEIAQAKLNELPEEEIKRTHSVSFTVGFSGMNATIVDIQLGDDGVWVFGRDGWKRG